MEVRQGMAALWPARGMNPALPWPASLIPGVRQD